MNSQRYLVFGIVLSAVGLLGLLFLAPRSPGIHAETLRTASDLLAVQQGMNRDHLAGFLPGDHARLTDRLRKKKFTSVSVMPTVIIGSHAISVGSFSLGTHLVLIKTGPTNRWNVSQDIQLGSRYFKSQLGTLEEPEVASTPPTNSPPASNEI